MGINREQVKGVAVRGKQMEQALGWKGEGGGEKGMEREIVVR